MAVSVTTSPDAVETGVPHLLFERRLTAPLRNRFVVTGDGQRFLVNSPVVGSAAPAFTVLVNWPALLKK